MKPKEYFVSGVDIFQSYKNLYIIGFLKISPIYKIHYLKNMLNLFNHT